MNKAKRLEVYNKYDGHCAYCGIEIEYKDMQVDHIKPLVRVPRSKKIEYPENDTFDNLICSCKSCNSYKLSEGLEYFRTNIEKQPERLLKYPMVRLAIRYGLLELKPKPIKFYFEQQTEENDGKS